MISYSKGFHTIIFKTLTFKLIKLWYGTEINMDFRSSSLRINPFITVSRIKNDLFLRHRAFTFKRKYGIKRRVK